MTHGRKPRNPRAARYGILGIALLRAARLSAAEIADTIAPARECEARLREGVASEDQHTVLNTILLVAQGIENSGIVRGLREHIDNALQAMATIRTRACASGSWQPTAPYLDEMGAIREALNLHEHQLSFVSAGELQGIAQKLIARTLSSGGVVQRQTHQSLGLGAA